LYSEKQVGEDKLKEWYGKLLMIRDVSKIRSLTKVQEKAEEVIFKSNIRWRHKGWTWLNPNN